LSVNRRSRYASIVAGIAIAGAIVAWLGRSADEPAARSQVGARENGPTQPRAPARLPESVVPASEQPPAPPSIDPRVQKFQQRERFQNEVREFFARAPALSPEERAARARDIASEITRYEAEGEVAAAEALTLRTALIRETVEDPVEQVVAIRALQDLYQQEGARKEAEWHARTDPEFELYKAREREIVAEVNAMTTIPDGLSRDEYLRRRLQSAREQLND
jgi:hypothetical protein